MKFVVRWLITAIAVAAAVWLIPGIQIVGGSDAALGIALASLALALVNMFIKPIVQVLSCPLVILTLGLFYLVINALMLELAAWLTTTFFQIGISIDGFGSAVLGAIVISLVSMIANAIFKDDTQQ